MPVRAWSAAGSGLAGPGSVLAVQKGDAAQARAALEKAKAAEMDIAAYEGRLVPVPVPATTSTPAGTEIKIDSEWPVRQARPTSLGSLPLGSKSRRIRLAACVWPMRTMRRRRGRSRPARAGSAGAAATLKEAKLPSDPGLLLWLRADRGVITDREGRVKRWEDQSYRQDSDEK